MADRGKNLRIDAARLWQSLMEMARIGATAKGGVNRLALTDLDRCTVMQHLSVLEKAGLVVVERRGRERWNHLDALPIHDVQKRWIGPYAAHAVRMLADLEALAETEARSAGTADKSKV